jgi:hypothetical protein
LIAGNNVCQTFGEQFIKIHQKAYKLSSTFVIHFESSLKKTKVEKISYSFKALYIIIKTGQHPS